MINSVISTENAKFMALDINFFYLSTPLDRFEYLKIRISDLPEDIIELYKVRDIETDGWVFVEIRKGMYGLPQAGTLANKLLTKRLETKGYYQCKTPGLWRYKWRPIMFTLVVDDFGVQYTGDQHAQP